MIRISQLKKERRRVRADLAKPDPMDTSAVKTLYYGHSFVNHYVTWEQNHQDYRNLGFDVDDVVMFYHGDGGASVDRLLQDDNLEHVERIAPELVIVEVGTNDLDSGCYGPQVIEMKIESLIRELKDRRVRFVVVNQVLYRGEAAYKDLPVKERRMAIRLNQCKTVSFNNLCEKRIPKMSNCMYKKHPGLWANINKLVNKRGVHLNDEGHKKLYQSLRSAVIWAKRIIRPAKYM